MKVKSAEQAALIVATCLSILSVGGAMIDYFFAGGPWEWYYVSYATAVFVAGYFITRYVIRKFIAYKIKPIYQIALSRDIKIRELENKFLTQDEMIDDIGMEVSRWVETQTEQIASLKQNEVYRRRYIGNLSHELKTPIFNIQGYVSTLLDGGLEDGAINRDYLEKAEKNIDRLINIVTDLEEISKLESGILQLNRSDFDLLELVRYVVDAMEFEAGNRNVVINISGDIPEEMAINADRKYIEQVITNLVSNAIHYTNEGGAITISFMDMFDKVGVEVSDTGIGIAKEDIPHIFERFYRVDKSRSRKEGGTGLGLAIVKHIMLAHEESVMVRSTPGVGSTFSVTLARAEKPEDAAVPPKAGRHLK